MSRQPSSKNVTYNLTYYFLFLAISGPQVGVIPRPSANICLKCVALWNAVSTIRVENRYPVQLNDHRLELKLLIEEYQQRLDKELQDVDGV